MASGLRKTSGNHFEIYYEKPWGGVASNAAPTDIDPSQAIVLDGVTIRNGLLCYTNIASQNSKFELTLITPTDVPTEGAYVTITASSAVPNDIIFGPVPSTPHPTVGYEYVQYTVPDSTKFPIGSVFSVAGQTGGRATYNGTGISVVSVDDATQFTADQPTAFGPSTAVLNGASLAVTYWDPTGGGGAPTDWPDAYICLIFNCGNFLCAVDQYGFAYIATLQMDGTIQFQYDQIATDGPSVNHGIPVAVKVVAGVAYISIYGTSTLYTYTPQVSYVVATTFTAGQFIDIFDEYMLQLNCNSTVDGIQPTLVSWSSPDEFSTWDPSVNRTAGFQALTSVEDYISGFVAVDNVGYIFKREGVTQITATGVAIQPFNFTTYWNSVAGQGLIFPGTLKQYGRYVFLVTDSSVYLFYGGTFTPIDEPARSAIYNSFNQNPPLNAAPNSLISAGFSIYPFNDKTPIAEYMFIAATNASVSGNIVFWFYNVEFKTWTTLTRSISDLLGEYVTDATNIVVVSIQTVTAFLNYVNGSMLTSISNLPTNITYITFSYSIGATAYRQTFIYYNLVNSPSADVTSITIPPGNLNLVFRAEEIKLGYSRKPTMRRVVIKAYGVGTLDINITDVSGVVTSMGTITLDGTTNQKTYYSPSGIATIEDPQLSITSTNFNGAIVKVMLAGTYADGDID